METIEIQQNVPFEADLYIFDDTVDPAVPIDITGLTVFISVKNLNDFKADDSSALITSKITVHIDPVNGYTIWALTPTQTYIPTGKYKADVRLYTGLLDYVNSDQFYVDIVPVVTRRLT